jgi:RNA polymerase sigma factor (sigma-70 family)
MMVSIYRIVQNPDDTADVFQDALYKVWNYLDRIKEHPNPSGYIMNICRSASYDFLRKQNKIATNEVPLIPELTQAQMSDQDSYQNREIIQLVQRTIASLPLQQAQALLLRLFEEESFQQIGSILGCSEATARSHFCKGIAKLRTLLQTFPITLGEV